MTSPAKWHTARDELTAYARHLLDAKLARCTEKQRETFKKVFPNGATTFDKLIEAIDLVNRTLQVNETRAGNVGR